MSKPKKKSTFVRQLEQTPTLTEQLRDFRQNRLPKIQFNKSINKVAKIAGGTAKVTTAMLTPFPKTNTSKEQPQDSAFVYYENPNYPREKTPWKSYSRNWDIAVNEANNIWLKPLNIAPETVITGYRPIILETYYPGPGSYYPLTGHSLLEIPITDTVRNRKFDYLVNDGNKKRSAGIVVDKESDSNDYNLVTNNCADATLCYLNKMFGTNESPKLFTTPGDVRDFAINKLHGTLRRGADGVDTVFIPRNKYNADRLSYRAANQYLKENKHTTYTSDYFLYPSHTDTFED